MSFEWPLALLGLVAVPLVLATHVFMQRRRSRYAARFAQPSLFGNLVAGAPGWRRHVPTAVLLLALAAVLVGVARPRATTSVPREEAAVILAIDTSRSMVATDVRPSRLAAARAAARAFLDKLPAKFRVGVVSFSTRAEVVAPATERREVVLAALRELRPGTGTALSEAILRSLEVGRGIQAGRPARERPPVAVLLLSDGAQTIGELTPLDAARQARSLGIPVYTVALGTPDGVVERRLPGGLRERISVPPDPETLRQVADTTNAEFFSAPDVERLSTVYRQLGSRLGHRKKRQEISFLFAAAGGALLLTSGAFSALWFRRLP